MSWFRFSSVVFAFWAVVFFFLPRFTNQSAGIGYFGSGHAEDWTQIVGLFSLSFAILLDQAHRSTDLGLRRIVGLGTLAFTLPCAFLMTYWQIIPDRRWFRLDIANIVLLYLVSYGMFVHAGLRTRRLLP